MEYDLKEYRHIKHDKIVKACLFKPGMEDGHNINGKPFIKAWDNGFLIDIPVTENDYIVISQCFTQNKVLRTYKFIFTKSFFERVYKEVL